MQKLSLIDKDLFVKTIKNLQKMYEEESKITKLFNIEPEWICGEWIYSSFELLNELIESYNDGDWLGYFCFELDFGKKWKEGMVTETDGTDVKLQTPEDLYKLLEDNYNRIIKEKCAEGN